MKERDIAVAIILSIVTCGIYAIYWFIVLTDDAKRYSGDNNMLSGGVSFLLALITCGIYGFYWAYRMGQIIEIAQNKNGVTARDNAILYLILQVFGLGIVNYALMQNDLNEITRKRVSEAQV